ncbi:MAG: transcriptional regulator [Clostridiales bacterium]|nr:transcriptional regulator [Clostridiales bacterium]
MDKNKLKQLIQSEEGPKLDFKLSLNLVTESDKKELTKDVIAMANSRGGRGYIIFGVEDKTKIIRGIDTGNFREEQIQQIIYNRCDPPVPISVDFIIVEDKTVAVITVFRSGHKPHMMLQNGAFYVRRGSTTDVGRRSEIANLFQEYGLMTYETVILKNASMEQLDASIMSSYFKGLNIISDKPDEGPNKVLLQAMGFIAQKNESEEWCPTIGGMMLFGRNPALFLPQVFIKAVCEPETRYIYGNVYKMMDDACAFIRQYVKDEDYPFAAAEEVVANAILHRDYMDTTRGIVINITEKNIEVSNPGSLIANNSIYKFVSEKNPDRRNSWLYQRLAASSVEGKRFFNNKTGLTGMKKEFDRLGGIKFLNIGAQNLFKVILPREHRQIDNTAFNDLGA